MLASKKILAYIKNQTTEGAQIDSYCMTAQASICYVSRPLIR